MHSTAALNGAATRKPGRRLAWLHSIVARVWLALFAATLGIESAVAQATLLRSQEGQSVRALLIGIDDYRHVRPLKGAVADAQDLEVVLRKMGVNDITTLVDGQANRAAILGEIEKLTQRVRPGDLVVLSIAGHGTQEPEKVRGSQPDGMDNVFLLAGFQASRAGSQERVIGWEFNHFIKQFEARGARVMFVADTCHGGGMAREVDPRAGEMSFRQVPRYVLTDDALKPVGTRADALLTELDFEGTVFLAAVDRNTKAPEVRIPGVPGLRGALSYAVARAFEGQADTNKDGRITSQELFGQVRSVVYQLSDQRQNPVTQAPPSRKLDSDVVFAFNAPGAQGALAAAAGPSAAGATKIRRLVIESAEPPADAPLGTIRIASLDAKAGSLAGLERRETPFEVVASSADADLVWDPKSGDVLAGGDVVAYRVDKADIPSVIDRSAAILGIKRLAAKAPQTIKVTPDDKLHRERKRVSVEIADIGGRSLILFNIAGNGTLQALYPVRSDTPILSSADYKLPLDVAPPFGADQIIAVTSSQRMLALEQALQQLNARRSGIQMMRMIERYAPSDARIGTIGIFTAP
jgi:hypothetical protein